MSDFRIRLAGAGDLDGIAGVIDAAYAPLRARIPGIPDMSATLAEDVGEGMTWIAVTERRITAVLIAGAGDGGLNIANLAVHPEAAGQGQASALLEMAETFARAGGAEEMRLTTHRDMRETRAFYRRRGWREIDSEGIRVFLTKEL